jgi:serine/threonine protein kinase
MKLWEFSEEQQALLIGIHLSKYGKIIGTLSSPYSFVYTLKPEYSDSLIVAKAPKLDKAMPKEDIQFRLVKLLGEINHIYSTCNHSLIHRFGQIQIIHGVPFLISQMRHMTLRDAMEEGPFKEVDAVAVAIQIARALSYAGSKGIVCHQDMKPENIFLDEISRKFRTDGDFPYKYQAYLADLDMANAAVLFEYPHGSRPYQATEQYQKLSAENSVRPDYSKVDIFSLGVNIFEMLSGGIHPLGVRTLDAWPKSILGAKWGREDIWKNWARKGGLLYDETMFVDKSLLDIVKSCLATDSNDRPSASEVQIQLMSVLQRLSPNAAASLEAYLKMIDDAEQVNTAAGWPHMDRLIRSVQENVDTGG